MSLVCGNCRETIYEGFGLLYRLEDRKAGKLLHPHEIKGGVPNSAICDACWSRIPEGEKRKGDGIQAEMDAGTEPVYIFLNADSERCLLDRAKEWSSIKTDPSTTVFVRTPLVEQHFAGAIKIISDMAFRLKVARKRRAAN